MLSKRSTTETPSSSEQPFKVSFWKADIVHPDHNIQVQVYFNERLIKQWSGGEYAGPIQPFSEELSWSLPPILHSVLFKKLFCF